MIYHDKPLDLGIQILRQPGQVLLTVAFEVTLKTGDYFGENALLRDESGDQSGWGQRYSHTKILLRRDSPARRCFHTRKRFHTQILFTQRYQRWIYTEELCAHRCHYKQRCFYIGGIYTRSCYIRSFLHRHTLTWYTMADTNSMWKSSASRCKTRISPQLLMI